MGFIESVSYVMRVLLLPNIFVGLLALIALLVKVPYGEAVQLLIR